MTMFIIIIVGLAGLALWSAATAHRYEAERSADDYCRFCLSFKDTAHYCARCGRVQ